MRSKRPQESSATGKTTRGVRKRKQASHLSGFINVSFKASFISSLNVVSQSSHTENTMGAEVRDFYGFHDIVIWRNGKILQYAISKCSF